jgi:hypothetical protein
MIHEADERDRDLAAVFRNHVRRFDDEPFVGSTLQRIEARRFRRAVLRGLLRMAAFVAIVYLSPFLVQGSVRLSDALEDLFAFGGSLLGTPLGTVSAVLCAVGAVLASEKGRLETINPICYFLAGAGAGAGGANPARTAFLMGLIVFKYA